MIGFRILLFLLLSSCVDPTKKINKPEGEILYFNLPISLSNNQRVQFWQSLQDFFDQNPSFKDNYKIPGVFVDLDQYMLLNYNFALNNYVTDRIIYQANELLVHLVPSKISQNESVSFPILIPRIEFHKIIFFKDEKIIFTTNISSL
ncbi:MAG: hypothetical protein ACRCS8_00800 [Brevinema sp.]